MSISNFEKENTELQKQLNSPNKQYYTNFLIYVRTHSFLKDGDKVESILLDVLQDIIEAQSNGISAEKYFGKNPKVIADELLKELPNKLIDTVKLILISIAAFSIATFFPSLLSPNNSIDIGKYLIGAIVAMLFVFGSLKLLGKSVYNNKKVSGAKFGMILFIEFIGLIALLFFIKTSLVIYISSGVGIVTILVLDIILLYLFVQEQDKNLWIPFVPVVIIFSICGILMRMNSFFAFFETKNGNNALAIIMSGTMCLWGILTVIMLKKVEK